MPSKVSKETRLRFIASKTDDGKVKGKLSLYCKVLNVSRQAFYKYLERKDLPWKYDYIVNSMYEILNEDQYNDTYGRYRMYKALKLKHQDDSDFYISAISNLICTNIATNDEAADKITFWIDDCLYQVKKTEDGHDIFQIK